MVTICGYSIVSFLYSYVAYPCMYYCSNSHVVLVRASLLNNTSTDCRVVCKVRTVYAAWIRLPWIAWHYFMIKVSPISIPFFRAPGAAGLRILATFVSILQSLGMPSRILSWNQRQKALTPVELTRCKIVTDSNSRAWIRKTKTRVPDVVLGSRKCLAWDRHPALWRKRPLQGVHHNKWTALVAFLSFQ